MFDFTSGLNNKKIGKIEYEFNCTILTHTDDDIPNKFNGGFIHYLYFQEDNILGDMTLGRKDRDINGVFLKSGGLNIVSFFTSVNSDNGSTSESMFIFEKDSHVDSYTNCGLYLGYMCPVDENFSGKSYAVSKMKSYIETRKKKGLVVHGLEMSLSLNN